MLNVRIFSLISLFSCMSFSKDAVLFWFYSWIVNFSSSTSIWTTGSWYHLLSALRPWYPRESDSALYFYRLMILHRNDLYQVLHFIIFFLSWYRRTFPQIIRFFYYRELLFLDCPFLFFRGSIRSLITFQSEWIRIDYHISDRPFWYRYPFPLRFSDHSLTPTEELFSIIRRSKDLSTSFLELVNLFIYQHEDTLIDLEWFHKLSECFSDANRYDMYIWSPYSLRFCFEIFNWSIVWKFERIPFLFEDW